MTSLLDDMTPDLFVDTLQNRVTEKFYSATEIRRAEEARKAPQEGVKPLTWYVGEPPFPQREEWFIAETIYGDRVVLRSLPKDFSYDYKTADETYMRAANVKRWMQFPDCEYAPPQPPVAEPSVNDELLDSLQWCVEKLDICTSYKPFTLEEILSLEACRKTIKAAVAAAKKGQS